jgi:hypothetical protein
MGIEPTSEAWELSETATYAPVSVRTNMSIRKERYWLRNRELVHGAKMYVMPQLGVRISWRERCKPGPRHHHSSRRSWYSEPIPSSWGSTLESTIPPVV